MASSLAYQNFDKTQDGAKPSTSNAMLDPEDQKVVYKDFVGRVGEAELVTGIFCCILGCISISLRDDGAEGSSGLWAGVFPCITGILGIIAKAYPTTGHYISNTVSAMVSSVLMVVLLIMNIIIAVEIHNDENHVTKPVVLYVVLCILAFIILILCTTHLMLGCIVLLCSEVNYIDPAFLQATDRDHEEVIVSSQLGSIQDLKTRQTSTEESRIVSPKSSKRPEEHGSRNMQSVVTVDALVSNPKASIPSTVE